MALDLKKNPSILVYRFSKAWRIFFVVIIIPFLVLAGFMVLSPILLAEEGYELSTYLLMMGIGSLLFVLIYFYLLYVFTHRCIIEGPEITSVWKLSKRTLSLDQIKGYRIVGKVWFCIL